MAVYLTLTAHSVVFRLPQPACPPPAGRQAAAGLAAMRLLLETSVSDQPGKLAAWHAFTRSQN